MISQAPKTIPQKKSSIPRSARKIAVGVRGIRPGRRLATAARSPGSGFLGVWRFPLAIRISFLRPITVAPGDRAELARPGARPAAGLEGRGRGEAPDAGAARPCLSDRR